MWQTATDTDVRPQLSRADIEAFLPPRGGFTFPAPYGTRGIRVTNDVDGIVLPVGYSYWPNVNAHGSDPTMRVFVGHSDGFPRFFSVHKESGEVEPLGTLVRVQGTGEGWYWSRSDPTQIYLPSANFLLRCNVLTGVHDVVMEIDAKNYVWQAHSSRDDSAHSATVRDSSTGARLASVAVRGTERFYYPANGVLDECQIDASGRFLVIKEDNDNRIVDLNTQAETVLKDADGAAGHSDCGSGTLVGEDDYDAQPGAMKRWELASLPSCRLEYHLTQWDTGLGHVSVAGNVALVSNAHRVNHPRVNELVVVPLDGSLRCNVVAPNLVDMGGPGGSDYDKMPKANLDAEGRYACWSANGHGRYDVFLVELP